MRPCVSYLAAAVFAGMLSLLVPFQAEAGPYGAAHAISVSQPQSAALLPVGYYGGGDYDRDDEKQDDRYDHYRDDHYGHEYKHDDYGSEHDYRDHDGGYGYDHYRKHYPDYSEGCYKKKWVCESSVPRCFRQRECVWYYGKEYCRYVRRCVGGGDNSCKWISVHSHDCGY